MTPKEEKKKTGASSGSGQPLTAWHSDMLANGGFNLDRGKKEDHARDKEREGFTPSRFAYRPPEKISPVPAGKLRIVPLGGLEEVGKNMMVLEYGDDVVVIDAGLMFPEEDMPGIDYVIPDVTYLQERKDRLRGIVITHGHMDHIGALPYILDKLGNPPVYATKLTAGVIEKRMEEFPQGKSYRTSVFNPERDTLKLGVFEISFFRVNHNIPDGVGLFIKTPVGNIVHTGDFKFDYTPIDEPVIEVDKISTFSRQGVLLLMSDSTNALKPGYSLSEQEIARNLEHIFLEAKGRIIVACFSSLISRIREILDIARKINRKVCIVGRSIISNFEVAVELGYLQVPPGLVVPPHQAHRLPDDKLLILAAGTQGEAGSALSKMSRGEHQEFKIKKGDTVVLSSSIIPGNERAVMQIYDNLTREGAKVVNYQLIDIHTGGHAQQEELKLMLNLVKPRYFMPIHGNRYYLAAHAEIAQETGIPEENCFVVDNGQIIEFDRKGKGEVTKMRAPTSYVMVDGLGVGDVGNIVLRDRQAMAQDGIFVVILTVDHNTGQIITSPDIISRGFVYMRAAEDLIHRARQEVKKMFRRHHARKPADWAYIKTMIREEMGEFLFRETQRRPMVIPVIIEV